MTTADNKRSNAAGEIRQTNHWEKCYSEAPQTAQDLLIRNITSIFHLGLVEKISKEDAL